MLLLDEIHRLDKTKQDFLLPLLESGLVIMIERRQKILSFCHPCHPEAGFRYLSLSPQQRRHPTAIQLALTDKERGFDFPVELDDEALDFIAISTTETCAPPIIHWI